MDRWTDRSSISVDRTVRTVAHHHRKMERSGSGQRDGVARGEKGEALISHRKHWRDTCV